PGPERRRYLLETRAARFVASPAAHLAGGAERRGIRRGRAGRSGTEQRERGNTGHVREERWGVSSSLVAISSLPTDAADHVQGAHAPQCSPYRQFRPLPPQDSQVLCNSQPDCSGKILRSGFSDLIHYGFMDSSVFHIIQHLKQPNSAAELLLILPQGKAGSGEERRKISFHSGDFDGDERKREE
ncbi:hypothetical protein Taro_027073, partial [Colocasia esculenta]|nr:hypothetical protein [Colocasia esculenta]